MVAVAVHNIAVQLFKLDTSLHKDDGIASWVPTKDDTVFWTLFRHARYGDYDQYPEETLAMLTSSLRSRG